MIDKPQTFWAIKNGNRFCCVGFKTRGEAIFQHRTELGSSLPWRFCYNQGDRAVKITVKEAK